MDVIQVFERAVSRNGDRVFLFDADATISYAEADERTNAIASDLVERGVTDGKAIALFASDRVSLWLAIIGAWKAGALPALIDARTSEDKLPYLVRDIDAALTLAAQNVAERLRAAGASPVMDIEQIGANASTAHVNRHGPLAPLYLSYTSGTTGAPKGVVLLSEPVTLGTNCIADRLELRRDDILLATTPTASSFQLVAALMPALHRGASVGLVAGASTEVIWNVAVQHAATVLVAYPLTLADVVNAFETLKVKSPFRLALSGGSSLAPRIKRDYRERLGIRLLESYGQSELGGFMAMGAMSDLVSAIAAGFAGRPLPDRLAYIGDDDCRELPAGDTGQVMVMNGFFDHYRNRPEKTAEAKRGGVLQTGDLGVANADGYVKVLGRLSEGPRAQRRGGFMRNVEDTYYENDLVRHAAVVENGKGEIEGFVEPKHGRQVTAELLQRFVSERVQAGLIPARTTVLEKMPRTFSGKVDRLTLSKGTGL